MKENKRTLPTGSCEFYIPRLRLNATSLQFIPLFCPQNLIFLSCKKFRLNSTVQLFKPREIFSLLKPDQHYIF